MFANIILYLNYAYIILDGICISQMLEKYKYFHRLMYENRIKWIVRSKFAFFATWARRSLVDESHVFLSPVRINSAAH